MFYANHLFSPRRLQFNRLCFKRRPSKRRAPSLLRFCQCLQHLLDPRALPYLVLSNGHCCPSALRRSGSTHITLCSWTLSLNTSVCVSPYEFSMRFSPRLVNSSEFLHGLQVHIIWTYQWPGGYNLDHVFAWIQRCIISIHASAAFPPRYLFPIAALSYHRLAILYSELVECGTWKVIFRLARQFGLLSLCSRCKYTRTSFLA